MLVHLGSCTAPCAPDVVDLDADKPGKFVQSMWLAEGFHMDIHRRILTEVGLVHCTYESVVQVWHACWRLLTNDWHPDCSVHGWSLLGLGWFSAVAMRGCKITNS